MTIYQCSISGRSQYHDGAVVIYSKRVHLTMTGADAYLPEFIELCTTPRNECDFSFIDTNQPYSTRIQELTLEDSP